ncbi:ROK family protein [Streptomyces sp. CA-142005]|uniref:ROK family protein n=1 Tax=Streptomyces sp. CA-142005 TaxID=3240052 RepID=UPI003D929B63
MSRHALGPATGLSSGSVSNVVTGLLADGLLEEAGVVGTDAGRPSRLLRIRPDSGRLIGVDVGETRVRVELLDLGLAELGRAERPLGPRGYDVEAVVGHVADGIADVLKVAGVPGSDLLGVGIGVPGIVEDTGRQGAVVHGQTVGWDAVPLERLLRASVPLPSHIPYFIDNGAKALGQAEMWFGAGRGARNAVVVLFGSGVGACVVTEEAARGRAVEWGHLTVRVGGRRCRCGSLGCLEAYAGASALVARWREAGGRPSAGADEEQALTELLAAARAEDGGATDVTAVAGLDGNNPPGLTAANGNPANPTAAVAPGGGNTVGSAATAGRASSNPANPTAAVEPGGGNTVGSAAMAGREGGNASDPTATTGPDRSDTVGLTATTVPDGSNTGDPAATAGPGCGDTGYPAAVAEPRGNREPDPVAVAVLDETAEYLGAGLSDLINLFQPERVLIGGWAGLQLGGAFLDQVRTHALARALRHPAGRVRIELGRLGPDAVTVGAAVLPLAAFFSSGGRRPRPAPDGETAPAWRAAVEGRLV